MGVVGARDVKLAILAGLLVAALGIGNPPMAGAQEMAPAPEEKAFTWDVHWGGLKDGLRYSLWQRVEVGGADAIVPVPRVREELSLSGKIGGKLAIDGAAFVTGGDLSGFDNGIEVRRARLYTVGDIHVLIPIFYKVEISVQGSTVVLEETYLGFRNVPLAGNLIVGNVQTPMGLEAVVSGRDLTFMEVAAPVQAFAPGVKAGILVGRPVFDNRATWALGVFSGSGSVEIGTFSGEATGVGRVTWLAVDRADAPGGPQLVHLGVSGSVAVGGNESIRYQARPESFRAPFIVDTGDLPVHGALLVGVEAAVVHGALSLQSEFFHSSVQAKDGRSLNFGGTYVSGSWFVTGESRPYDRTAGLFGRVVPRRDFSFTGGGLGAVELGARYSHVDLNDGPVTGGVMDLGTLGLTWYWNAYAKLKLNYIVGGVKGGAQSGRLQIFQARVEFDF
jgi:phosphate-selective porin OprO/OprP